MPVSWLPRIAASFFRELYPDSWRNGPRLWIKRVTTNLEPMEVEATLRKILETLESSKAPPTTPKPEGASSNANAKRRWLDKWLRLNTKKHPQLLELEDAIYQFCSGYAKNPTTGYRLVIFGENGVGKSHAARAVHHWAKSIALHIPLVVGEELNATTARSELHNWAQLMNLVRAGQWEFIEQLIPLNLLVLDDVGAEHDPSKFGSEKLYLLLERRVNRWTIITTNIHQSEWENKMDRRIASRLFRNCQHVCLDSVPDYNTR